ncbi:REP-associated tyrosine transposase [Mucisphaera calidilacus]|nr:transposase [Mucisphaera calidilacus]
MMMSYRNEMRRREVVGPRFLTFSCYRRFALFREVAWRDLFVSSLLSAQARYGFRLYAWVVMPEHVHLVLDPKRVATGDVLRSIKQPVAQRAIRVWRQQGSSILKAIAVGDGYRFWQAGGGYDRNVRDEDELVQKIRYVRENPVKRGLVERPEDWAWSSVSWG